MRRRGASFLSLLSGVKLDDNGYVLVDSNLRSVSSPTVFGGGDCISLRGSSVPKVRAGNAVVP